MQCNCLIWNEDRQGKAQHIYNDTVNHCFELCLETERCGDAPRNVNVFFWVWDEYWVSHPTPDFGFWGLPPLPDHNPGSQTWVTPEIRWRLVCVSRKQMFDAKNRGNVWFCFLQILQPQTAKKIIKRKNKKNCKTQHNKKIPYFLQFLQDKAKQKNFLKQKQLFLLFGLLDSVKMRARKKHLHYKLYWSLKTTSRRCSVWHPVTVESQ